MKRLEPGALSVSAACAIVEPKASDIALAWDGELVSNLVNVSRLDQIRAEFLEAVETRCVHELRIRPLDDRAKARWCVSLSVRGIAAQDRLSSASPVVQFCVIYGRAILGERTRNVSSCLCAAVANAERVIARLGGLCSPFVASVASVAVKSPRSRRTGRRSLWSWTSESGCFSIVLK